jgi:hypothetical protein
MDASPPSNHPSDQTLRAYAVGKLHSNLAESVYAHLGICGDCRQRVVELSADTFLIRLRGVQARQQSPPSVPAGPPFASMLMTEGSRNAITTPPASSLPPGLAEYLLCGPRPGCSAAGAGTASRATAGRRSATGARRGSGCAPWASVWPEGSPAAELGSGSVSFRAVSPGVCEPGRRSSGAAGRSPAGRGRSEPGRAEHHGRRTWWIRLPVHLVDAGCTLCFTTHGDDLPHVRLRDFNSFALAAYRGIPTFISTRPPMASWSCTMESLTAAGSPSWRRGR